MSVAYHGVFVPPNKQALYLLLLSLFSRLRTQSQRSLAQGYTASKQRVNGQGGPVASALGHVISGYEQLHVVKEMGCQILSFSTRARLHRHGVM